MNKQDRTNYYNQDIFWKLNFLEIDRDRLRLEHIVKIIPSDVNSILDIGCGNGYILNFLHKLHKYEKLVGVDFSSTALDYLQTEKYLMDISELNFEDNSFDLVMCNEVLEHLTQDEYAQALSELQRISRKYILVTVPNNENLEDNLVCCPKCSTWFNQEYHVRSFAVDDIQTLFDSYKLEKHWEVGPKIQIIKQNRVSRLFNLYLIKPLPSTYAICPTCQFQNEQGKKRIQINLIYRGIIKILNFTNKTFNHSPDIIAVWTKE